MAKHQGQLNAGNKASIRAVVRSLVIARKALENKVGGGRRNMDVDRQAQGCLVVK